MSYAIQKTSSHILVTIQDELTVAQVREFRDGLLTVTCRRLPVFIDAGNAKRIDASVLQVLHSLRKTIGALTFQECGAPLRDYLARAGVVFEKWVQQGSPNRMAADGGSNG